MILAWSSIGFFSGRRCWNSLDFFTGIVWIFLSGYCERKGGAVGLHREEVKCRASAQQSLVGGSEEYSVCWSMLLGPKWMGVSFHTFINSQISAALEKQPEGVNTQSYPLSTIWVARQQVLTEKVLGNLWLSPTTSSCGQMQLEISSRKVI